MKKFNLYILLISISLLLFSCGNDQREAVAELPPVSVETKQVENFSSGGMISASGAIEAKNSANLSTRMMGHITSLSVKMGQEVKKGELLAKLSSQDLEAKRAQARAGISSAEAAFQNAKKDFDRYTILFEQNSVSQKELDEITTHYNMTKSGLKAAEQMQAEVNAQFSYTDLRAPFDGKITGTFAKEGEMANPGMPILSIENPDKLQAIARISESKIGGIHEGMKAEVFIKSIGKNLKGEVVEISSSARNTGGQYLIKIDLPDTDAKILSGMYVDVVFETEKTENDQTLITVPKSALIEKGQLKGIYVVNDQDRAMLRWLRLGKNFGEEIEVLSGLSMGESYVLKADDRLYNGSKINRK